MNTHVPFNLRYTPSHEWIRVAEEEGLGIVYVGVTNHVRDHLGEIVYISLPSVNTHVEAGQNCGIIESARAASEIYAPLSGKILAINDDVRKDTDLVKNSCYEAWLFKMKLEHVESLEQLMDAAEYESIIHAPTP